MPRFGAIIKINSLKRFTKSIEQVVQVHASWTESLGDVYQVQGKVYLEGQVLAEAKLTIIEFS